MKLRIKTWQRKILRRIYGAEQTDIGRKRRVTKAFIEMFNETVTSNFIKWRRQLLGYLEIMNREREVKGIAWKIPAGKRKKPNQ